MVDMNSVPELFGKDRFGSNEMQFMDAGLGQWRISIRTPLWRPPTDVFETEESIVVRVEIAGMHDEDFTIELDGRLLSIRGVRPDNPARRAYHQMEIRFGEFSIELEMPAAVAAEQVGAVYDNGFLILTLPKVRPYHISIEDRD
jgi:HSP20 family protein